MELGLWGELLPEEGLEGGLDGDLDGVLRGGLEVVAERGLTALNVGLAGRLEVCRRGSGQLP